MWSSYGSTRRPVAATPRRTTSPGVRAPTRARRPSTTGRRPVSMSKRSSPGAKPPVTVCGSARIGLNRKHPARVQHLRQPGQLGLDRLADPRLERVGQTELGHAAPLPVRPAVLGVGRRRLGVAFEERDVVAVAGEEDPGELADDAAAEHDDSATAERWCVHDQLTSSRRFGLRVEARRAASTEDGASGGRECDHGEQPGAGAADRCRHVGHLPHSAEPLPERMLSRM